MIEGRSIDHIPEAERHGGIGSQFTLWFGNNLQITAVVTGALAVVLGGDVFWSLIALLIGQLLGGAVMALHGAQGPQLGLPQMISSRVQFGVYGATIPIIAVCLMYVGFSAGGSVLAGQAMAKLLGLDEALGILAFGAVIVGVTFCGYRLIHMIGRAMSAVGACAFLFMFASLLANNDIGALLAENRHFTINSFLLAMSLSASWQIAYGPYVADYSRYLPSDTPPARTFLAVGAGSVLGTQISMTFGVFAAALAGASFEHHEVDYIVGLGSGGAVAGLLFFCVAFGKVMATSLNAYGSFMSMATIVSGFRPGLRVTKAQRLGTILLMVGISIGLALAGRHSFPKDFQAFILFLLTLFTPWSAINLVDYYFVTRSRYDIAALSDPDGVYGRWNATGIIVYFIGVAAQMPFIATGFYTGPLASWFGGADISWIVGLTLPALLYYAAASRPVRRQQAG